MHHVLSQNGTWIIITLSRKVRVFTNSQIAKGWFNGDIRRANAEIKQLEKQELAETHTNLVGNRLPISEPLLIWEPGSGNQPKFSKIANQARNRWDSEMQQELLVVATTKAVNRFAGFTNGKPPTECALSHDLQIAELYLHFLAENPRRARRFVGEDEWKHLGYCSHKVAVPDAVILHKRRQKHVLLELVGRYPAERLIEFHRQYMGFKYELW